MTITKINLNKLISLAVIAIVSILIAASPIFSKSAEAAKKRISPVKNVKVTQNIETQKIKVTCKKQKGTKKVIYKVRQGTTVLKSKKHKKRYINFTENLLVHGTKYNVRIKAAKTNKKKASKWRKKVFTYEDQDLDNDYIANDEDPDDDNDGIPDEEDEYPHDHDNDGTPDYEDDDDDNDLIDDDEDDYPYDHDNDGIDDIDDPDDDGDGINDDEEEEGQEYDKDNDGTPDAEDDDYIDEITPDPETHSIDINDDGMSDNEITIAVGDYVKWTNKDTFNGHTIKASDDSWESDPLLYGDSYTRQFNTAGSFDYYDPTFSSESFTGTIIVEE